jgi:hypothetical protein
MRKNLSIFSAMQSYLKHILLCDILHFIMDLNWFREFGDSLPFIVLYILYGNGKCFFPVCAFFSDPSPSKQENSFQ